LKNPGKNNTVEKQCNPGRGDLFVEINVKRERKLRRSGLYYA
jgi:hypothetical protein